MPATWYANLGLIGRLRVASSLWPKADLPEILCPEQTTSGNNYKPRERFFSCVTDVYCFAFGLRVLGTCYYVDICFDTVYSMGVCDHGQRKRLIIPAYYYFYEFDLQREQDGNCNQLVV